MFTTKYGRSRKHPGKTEKMHTETMETSFIKSGRPTMGDTDETQFNRRGNWYSRKARPESARRGIFGFRW